MNRTEIILISISIVLIIGGVTVFFLAPKKEAREKDLRNKSRQYKRSQWNSYYIT